MSPSASIGDTLTSAERVSFVPGAEIELPGTSPSGFDPGPRNAGRDPVLAAISVLTAGGDDPLAGP
jgi:hypothetical protein